MCFNRNPRKNLQMMWSGSFCCVIIVYLSKCNNTFGLRTCSSDEKCLVPVMVITMIKIIEEYHSEFHHHFVREIFPKLFFTQSVKSQ